MQLIDQGTVIALFTLKGVAIYCSLEMEVLDRVPFPRTNLMCSESLNDRYYLLTECGEIMDN